MLLPDFYSIKQIVSEGNTHTATVSLNKEHTVYSGHFPGSPVTPGVCTLQIIKECAQEITGYRLTTTGIASSKFVGMIIPDRDSQLTVRLTLEPNNDSWSCKADVSTESAVVLKLKCTYSPR